MVFNELLSAFLISTGWSKLSLRGGVARGAIGTTLSREVRGAPAEYERDVLNDSEDFPDTAWATPVLEIDVTIAVIATSFVARRKKRRAR
jgi:hypothetical protein